MYLRLFKRTFIFAAPLTMLAAMLYLRPMFAQQNSPSAPQRTPARIERSRERNTKPRLDLAPKAKTPVVENDQKTTRMPSTEAGEMEFESVLETLPSRIDISDKYNATQQFSFSPDGKFLVEVSDRENTRLRSTVSGQPEFELPEDTDYKEIVSSVVPPTRSVQYRFCARSKNSTIELISIHRRRRLGEIRIDGKIRFGVVSDDGRTIACGMKNGPLLLFDATSGERQGAIEPPGGLEVYDIAIDSRGTQLAVSFVRAEKAAKQGPKLVLYSLTDLTQMATFNEVYASNIHFTPDGQKVATYEGGKVVVRRSVDGQRTAVIRDVENSTFTLSNDGSLLFCELDEDYRGTESCVIGAFDTSTGNLVRKFSVPNDCRVHKYSPATIRVSPNGRQLAALIYGYVIWWQIPDELASQRQKAPVADGTLPIGGPGIVAAPISIPLRSHRKIARGHLRWFLQADALRYTSIESQSRDFRGDGRLVDTLTVRRFDGRTGRSIDRVLPGGPAGLPRLSSRNGRVWLAHDRGVDFWNAERLELIGSHSNKQTGGQKTAAALAPDGGFALVRGKNGVIVRHEPSGGQVKSHILTTDFKAVTDMAISPDNQRAAVVLQGGDFQVWVFDLNNPASRTQLAELPDIRDCRDLMFSPDGKFIVMTDDDKIVVWSAGTGAVVRRIEQERIGYGLDVSGDGKWIATFAEDETGSFVALWDMHSGHLIARLDARDSRRMPKLRFSADGNLVLGLCEDRGWFVWDISSLSSDTGGGESSEVVTAGTTAKSAGVAAANAKAVPLFLKLNFDLKSIAFTAEENVLAGDGQRIDLSTGTGMTYVSDLDQGNVLIWQSANGARFIAADNDKVDSNNAPQKRSTPQLARWSPDAKDYLTTTLKIPLPPAQPVNGRIRLATHTRHVPYGNYTSIDSNRQQNQLVTVHQDGKCFLWAVGRVFRPDSYKKYGRGQAECFVEEIAEATLSAGFLPNRNIVVTSGEDGLTAFHSDSRKPIGKVFGPEGTIFQFEFDHAGTQLVTFGNAGLQLWRLKFDGDRMAAERSAVVLSADNPVTNFRFSPDNGVLAIGLEDRPPLLYETGSRKFSGCCDGSGFGCRDIGFSLDGQQLAGACDDGKLRIWNLSK